MRLDRSIPPERDLPRLMERKRHLVSELSSGEATTRRRRRRLTLVAVPAVIAALAATGFTAYTLTREPTHLESIGCYDRAALDANVAVVNSDERDPTDTCGEVWRTGGLGRDEGKIPELTACVLQTGAVGVFPGPPSKTCSGLGLANLPPNYTAASQGFAGLRDAIVAQLGVPASGTSLGSLKCVGEDDARAIVRRELDVRGYGDWKIEVGAEGYTAKRPCTEVSFDGARKVVVLVPVWDE